MVFKELCTLQGTALGMHLQPLYDCVLGVLAWHVLGICDLFVYDNCTLELRLLLRLYSCVYAMGPFNVSTPSKNVLVSSRQENVF